MKIIEWAPLVAAVNDGWTFSALIVVLIVWVYVRKKDGP